MRYIRFTALILGLVFLGCNQKKEPESFLVKQTDSVNTTANSADREEIQQLIRQVLNWANSDGSFDLLPILTDSKDKVYIGFDLNKHWANLDRLRKTGFFTTDFIENYNQIILTLDRKLRNKEFDNWLVGELPTFTFANDVNPWSLCQDVPYDKPNLWNLFVVEIINLENKKGELDWKWGKPEINSAPGWKKFKYKFKVEKINGKWRIAYLQGFDFKESTKKKLIIKQKKKTIPG